MGTACRAARVIILITLNEIDMEDIVRYLKTWLLYGHPEADTLIGYTADKSQWKKYRLVIVPNGHLGKCIVEPDLTHPHAEILDGEPIVVRQDLIYNTFYYVSRAEELLHTQRDEHGRYYVAQPRLTPLLDEYARFLLKALQLPLPGEGFSHIYLTHDIDTISHYRHLRGALGGIIHGNWRDVIASWQSIEADAAFTFPWLAEQDHKVASAESIYFIKKTTGRGYDYPQYSHNRKDYKELRKFLEWNNALVGWHSSYYGVKKGHYRVQSRHRSHYLRCSIENMRQLIQLGVTDDFTMGFAASVGFRMNTTRAVLWIDPERYELTELVLHPLMIMDCTLDEYMHLSHDEAYYLCQQVIDKVKMHHGDLCLLWHNSNLNNSNYRKQLYEELIDYIK